MSKDLQKRMSPDQALLRLKEGNRRFYEGKEMKRMHKEEIANTASGQYPYAVILSCIDSRTSSEIIFDQGIGDIFNIRLAGNVANTDVLGSMEFACKLAGAKLVIVLGHNKCGAVKGTCDHAQLGNLTQLLEEIKPAMDSVSDAPGERTSSNNAFVQAVAEKNVKMTIRKIRNDSAILKEMEQKGEINIVGGMYDISTGKVEFFPY
jgi:carbonic anhydrase